MRNRYLWKKLAILAIPCGLSLSGTALAQEEETLAAFDGLSVVNETGADAEELLVKKATEETWETDLMQETEFAPETDTVYDLKLVAEDGNELLFYDLTLDETTDLHLCERDDGAAYVTYAQEDAPETTDNERFAVVPEEEPQTMYAKVRLNIRQMPTTETSVRRVLAIGEEVAVYGEAKVLPEAPEEETEAESAAQSAETQEPADPELWYLIRDGEGYGYISGKYVTDSKEEADRLIAEEQARIQAEAEARARAEAAAAEQARAQAQAQAAAKAKQKKASKKKKAESKKEVVKKEKVPNCDDPDHGMLYITYSDGSVDAKEY